MGAERSTEATKVTAAPAVAWHTIECGENAPVYARGLVSRGYGVKGYALEEDRIVCTAPAVGKVETTAPASVFEAMDTAFKTRGQHKKK